MCNLQSPPKKKPSHAASTTNSGAAPDRTQYEFTGSARQQLAKKV